MQLISVTDNGTTTIELTDAEAHAIRDALTPTSGSDPAWTLQRLLAHAHGEPGNSQPAT